MSEQELNWLCGDFEGETVGCLPSGKNQSEQGETHFQLTIKSGVLCNVASIEEPFFESSDQIIKQTVVHEVLMESKDGGSFVKFSIPNFYLFDWKEVNYLEIMDCGNKALLGKVKGRACFPVTEDLWEEELEKTEEEIVKKPDLCWLTLLCLGLALSLVVGYFGGWWHAAIFAAPVLVVASRTPSNYNLGWAKTAFFICVLASSIGIYLLSNQRCGDSSLFIIILGLTLSGLAFLLSLLFKKCWNKLVLLVLWFVAVMVWSIVCDSASQDFIKDTKQTVKESAEEVKDVVDKNVARRVSVSEALKNPELLENKYNTLYFKNEVLFDYNKFDVREEGGHQLEKLSKLLKTYPDSKLTIIGHTDQQGEKTMEGRESNKVLSKKRADSVRNWLIKHGGFDADRFSTMGKGSSDPIHRYPISEREFAENRRVEYKFKVRVRQP